MNKDMTLRCHHLAARRQQGAILVVSLILLLVMTVLALGASQSTRMQERMAGNLRDRDLALQSAEAGLRTGERLLDDPALTSAPFPCTTPRCRVYELNTLTGNVAYQLPTWWNTNAWQYSASESWSGTTSNAIRGAGMARWDPQFFVEEMEEVTDALTIPPSGPPPSRIYYRITSSGRGGTDTAQVVLQSTFARRF
jgi:type IV pilus assembly protein PilX